MQTFMQHLYLVIFTGIIFICFLYWIHRVFLCFCLFSWHHTFVVVITSTHLSTCATQIAKQATSTRWCVALSLWLVLGCTGHYRTASDDLCNSQKRSDTTCKTNTLQTLQPWYSRGSNGNQQVPWLTEFVGLPFSLWLCHSTLCIKINSKLMHVSYGSSTLKCQ